MVSNSLYLYFVIILVMSIIFNSIKTLQKFFFLSEIMWILLFLLLLNFELLGGTIVLMNNCFFILVFTAIEALLLACIFLLQAKQLF